VLWGGVANGADEGWEGSFYDNGWVDCGALLTVVGGQGTLGGVLWM